MVSSWTNVGVDRGWGRGWGRGSDGEEEITYNVIPLIVTILHLPSVYQSQPAPLTPVLVLTPLASPFTLAYIYRSFSLERIDFRMFTFYHVDVWCSCQISNYYYYYFIGYIRHRTIFHANLETCGMSICGFTESYKPITKPKASWIIWNGQGPITFRRLFIRLCQCNYQLLKQWCSTKELLFENRRMTKCLIWIWVTFVRNCQYNFPKLE